MRISLFAVLGVLLFGCGNPLEATGAHKSEVVVLAKEPVVLGEDPVVFRGERPMQVLGEQAMVCLVLRGDVPIRDSDSEALFKESLNDAQVNISVKLTSGEIHQLSEPMPGWRRFGQILRSGELLGCSSDCCDNPFSVGAEVEEVTITSSKAVTVQGIFWESTDKYDHLGKKP